MTSNLLWLVALGPLALIGACLIPTAVANLNHRPLNRFAQTMSFLSFIGALATVCLVALHSSLHTPLAGTRGIGFSLYIDTISATMFVLVSFIGMVVVAFSQNYLAGDPGHGRFMKMISMTLGSVLLLIVAGNFFQFLAAWVSTSLALHGLLTFYSERPSAILAARKKWVVSRLGDLCILGAIVLLYSQLGSLDYAIIFKAARETQNTSLIASPFFLVAPLLALAALLKSAQFPIHGWLLEVMETPTPVSALLHAGVINAGGFLILRFSSLVSLSPFALNMLLIVGAVTAIFGSLVMLTQTSVKVSLAYSTVAQMGFMMLEFGLGMFSAAMLHIIAHSLYKAHAFLSSGETVARAPSAKTHTKSASLKGAFLTSSLVVFTALLTVTIVGVAFDSTLFIKPGSATLSYIFVLGLVTLSSTLFDGRLGLMLVVRFLARLVGITLLFFGVQYFAEALFAGHLAHESSQFHSIDIFLRVFIIFVFSAITILQSVLSRTYGRELWIKLYVHLANGFYINTIGNSFAIRFWPSAAPRSTVPQYIPTYPRRGDS